MVGILLGFTISRESDVYSGLKASGVEFVTSEARVMFI
jgi:hypothetical protein